MVAFVTKIKTAMAEKKRGHRLGSGVYQNGRYRSGQMEAKGANRGSKKAIDSIITRRTVSSGRYILLETAPGVRSRAVWSWSALADR